MTQEQMKRRHSCRAVWNRLQPTPDVSWHLPAFARRTSTCAAMPLFVSARLAMLTMQPWGSVCNLCSDQRVIAVLAQDLGVRAP
jgi:hypothetical protein